MKVEAVRDALAAVNAHEQLIFNYDPEIQALIERWETYNERSLENEEHVRHIAAQVSEAERSVEDSEKALIVAQEEAQPVTLSAVEEARLEELSDLADESQQGMWKKSPTEEDEAERNRLLAKVGVESWTEYTMSRMSSSVPADKLAAVKEAELNLDVSKLACERAKSYQAGDAVSGELADELESIQAEAEPYLGPTIPADIGTALAAQVSSSENPDWTGALDDLRQVLSSNDLRPPHGFEPSEILGWADSWLRAEESIDSSNESDQHAEDEEDPAERTRNVYLGLARHKRALTRIGLAERAALQSAIRVRDLKKQLQARSTTAEPTTAAEVLAMIAPVAEQILSEVGGSIPVAVVGELAAVSDPEIDPMMRAIEEVAKQVQVIMVTTNERVIEWVGQVGLERASLASGARILI